MTKTINNEDNFSLIYFWKTEKKKTLIILFCSFLYAFANTSLLTKAASVPSGMSSISMSISLILPILKPYLNFIYLVLNIPLFIIFWKKIKKSYMYLTVFFLVSNAIFGFLIGFDFGSLINGKEMSLDFLVSQYILILCPPTNEFERAYANEHNLNNLMTVNLNEYNTWIHEKYYGNTDIPLVLIKSGKTLGCEKGWPIFVYSLLSVVLAAIAAANSWKMGTSTGGTDIITYYFSTKNKTPIGSILIIISFLFSSFSLIILWSLSKFGPVSIAQNINGFDSLMGLQTLSSIIYIFLFGKILNVIYPKYEKVVIRLDTLNVEKLKTYFKESNYNHPYKIHTLTSGKTGKNIYSFETVVLLLESEDLIKKLKEIDPQAWIYKVPVDKIYGQFDYSKVE
ncbi:MAG: YitT family protein [Mycoplasmataceae bacterium]|nr:YitT family protein [Mycoplasmataceae bacterium]MBR4025807.1 YitT family protein [Mycoplasmataceae bacterium]